MTVIDAIKALEKVRDKYGPDVLVYFDCPCTTAFTPGLLDTRPAVAFGSTGKKGAQT